MKSVESFTITRSDRFKTLAFGIVEEGLTLPCFFIVCGIQFDESFCGLGNIVAQFVSSSQRGFHLVSHNGSAGYEAPKVVGYTHDLPENAVLIMFSDGIKSRVTVDPEALEKSTAATIAGLVFRDGHKAHDYSTVLVVRFGSL